MSPILLPAACYHVSAERQGQSGIDLDARRFAVSPRAPAKDLLSSFEEIGNSRKDNLARLPIANAVPPEKGLIGNAKLGGPINRRWP